MAQPGSAPVPPHGAPTPNSLAISRLSQTPEGLVFTGDFLTYRVTGLQPYNLDRLNITLKATVAESPTLFHIDRLDLYNSRARESFVETCAKALKAQPGTMAADLSSLIMALESERVSMRESGNSGPQVPPMTEQEKKDALSILKSKDLLKTILSGFDSLGYIGESRNKIIGFLAGVSRFLPDPLAVLFLSRPGAGKTGLQNAICKLVPTESVIQYTRVTGQSLFYREPNALKNKVLAIEEEEGLKEAMYSVKTLISSQRLSISATRTDAKTGKFSVEDYTVNGPVVVMVSTTNPDGLDDETKGRFLTLTIDESPEQTKKVLQAQIAKNSHDWYTTTADEEAVLKQFHGLQRLLRPLTVTFSRDLKIIWPFGRLQMRREQQKFLSLVKSIVILHQHQRKTGTLKRLDGTTVEWVQATQKDIDTALDIGREVFARNVDDCSPMGRTLLSSIVGLVGDKRKQVMELSPDKEISLAEVPFTRKELRELIGWSEPQVRRNLDQLVELGYIGRLSGRQGSTFRYVLLDDGSTDPELVFGEQFDPTTPSTKNQ